MTDTHALSDAARLADTPWAGRSIAGSRGVAVRPSTSIKQTSAQRKAISRMSALELECGITPEEFERIHGEQRARVRARYGIAA